MQKTSIKRTIELSREAAHLATRDNQLLILRKDINARQALPAHPPNLAATIPMEDIGFLVVDEHDTTYSHSALAKLAEMGAAVLICGRNHLPAGVLLPMAEHTEVVWRQDDQINASLPLRKQLWQRIVRVKIVEQADALPNDQEGKQAKRQLERMTREVTSGDTENHEAQAASVYWRHWLGVGDAPALQAAFSRDATPNLLAPPPNNFLNYGYAIIRAAVARALVGAGLLASLGIKHRHRSNSLCLADDLMEPFRPMVDVVARELFLRGERVLNQANKARFLLLLTATVQVGSEEEGFTTGPLMVAMHRYAASLARAFASGKAGELVIPFRVDPRAV